MSETKEYIRVSDDKREISFVYKADNKENEDKALKNAGYFVMEHDYILEGRGSFLEDGVKYQEIRVHKPEWRGPAWSGGIL